MQGHRAAVAPSPERPRGDLVAVSPPLPAVPTQPKAAAASRGLCGAAGSVPGPAGTMGATCSRHPGPGRVGVGRSGDLELCKLEACQ